MRQTAGRAAAPAARCRKFRRGSFIPFLSACRRRASFRLDVGRPGDRPPLIDLCLVVGIEGLPRLLFARRKLPAAVSEAPFRGGGGAGGRGRGGVACAVLL